MWRQWNAVNHDEIIFATSMSTRKIVLVSVLGLLAIVASGVGFSVMLLTQVLEKEWAKSEAEARKTYANPMARITPESNLDFDPRREQALTRNSEEVFIGEVERLVARGDNDPTPFLEGWSATARFAVRVEEVLKDDSPGGGLKAEQTITVNQLGVPPPDTKATVCFGSAYPNGGHVEA